MELGLDTARDFIADVQWSYARTMPDWPHEYTVKPADGDGCSKFEGFCRLIAREGTVEPWPLPPRPAIYHNHYLVIDGHRYWALGPRGDLDPPEEMTIINRAVHARG